MHWMERRLTIKVAMILAALTWQQAAAETRQPRRPPPAPFDYSQGRDLSRPRYPATRHGDLSIRHENESLRNNLLGQSPIGSSLRR